MSKIKFISLTASMVLVILTLTNCGEVGNGNGDFSSSGSEGEGNSITYGNDTYPIVVIGTQTWLAKNLNYAVAGSKCYGEGSEVIIETSGHESAKTLSLAEVQTNCTKYGRLYDWQTAKTVCPSGWHLPTDVEWTTLIYYSGGSSNAGKKLKAKSGWNNGNGTNDYGFSALPGGAGAAGISGNYFGHAGIYGYWWSASEIDSGEAYLYSMHTDNETYKYREPKFRLLSVRCVKDDEVDYE
jgi:uncharacterized protein (TIGR02145 family)